MHANLVGLAFQVDQFFLLIRLTPSNPLLVFVVQ